MIPEIYSVKRLWLIFQSLKKGNINSLSTCTLFAKFVIYSLSVQNKIKSWIIPFFKLASVSINLSRARYVAHAWFKEIFAFQKTFSFLGGLVSCRSISYLFVCISYLIGIRLRTIIFRILKTLAIYKHNTITVALKQKIRSIYEKLKQYGLLS